MKCCVVLTRGAKPLMIFTVSNVTDDRDACQRVLNMDIFEPDDTHVKVQAIDVESDGLPVEVYTIAAHRKGN